MQIVTHDGKFHTDEVLAVAVLKLHFGDIPVTRTRDQAVIRAAKQVPDTLLLDIGGRYDPDWLHFDHHQAEGAGYRDDAKTQPYATAGLIWRHYGGALLQNFSMTTVTGKDCLLGQDLDPDEQALVFRTVDERLFCAVDAIDCGRKFPQDVVTFSTIIAMMNDPHTPSSTVAFNEAVALAMQVLTNLIKSVAGPLLMTYEVRAAAMAGDHANILVLNEGMPWKEIVARQLHAIRVVVVRNGEDRWNVQIANGVLGTPRCSFPKTWYGKTGDELAQESGVNDAIFCHRSGFIAAASSKTGALKMAHAAVANLT